LAFNPQFKLGVFGRSPALNEQILYILLDALVAVDELVLRHVPGIPPLYKSGVFYKSEPLGVDACGHGFEDWCDIIDVMKQGHADCEDLAAWRVAELRAHGVAARPYVRKPRLLKHKRVLMYHIQVLLPDGRIEDPSRRLGMGQERRYGSSHNAGATRGRRRLSRIAA
jgi:hypothetical protein